MARGVEDAGAAAVRLPVADGGDGTLDVLLAASRTSARVTAHRVTDALGRPTTARLGWLDGERVAVVEMAEAVGLRKLGPQRDALGATSYGAGELILAAVAGGAREITVGVGGSASSDGGAGLLQAVGARLLDGGGRDVGRGGAALSGLESIDLASVPPAVRDCRIEVAADVRAPLYGRDGAACVFAAQKGASPVEVESLDRALRHLAAIAERDLGAAGLALRPGSGAAGGCGYALALLGAHIRDGAALVCDRVGLDAELDRATAVLTGEGRLDSQTASGKAPAEVAARSRRRGLLCAAIAGAVTDPPAGMFDAVYSLTELAGGADPRTTTRDLLRTAAALAVRRFSGPA